MAEPLTAARFAALAEAYGSIDRWPEDVRVEGLAMSARPELAALVAEAAALDARLDLWTVTQPSLLLRSEILAGRWRSLGRRLRVWWSALGLATALAGAAAGSLAAAAVPVHHPYGDDTAFGNLSPQED